MMSKSENIVEFPDLKAIEEEAAVWVARIDAREELSSKDLATLKAWIATSSQHREAFERMATLWLGADVLDELNYCGDTDKIRSRSNWSRARSWWSMGAAAAVMLIASGFVMLEYFAEPVARQSGEFATLVGEQETVSLADGSTINLNTNSQISVALGENTRTVTLLKGEAHFEVAHDPDRPFLVVTHGGIVRAVGTAFTVFLHREKVEVTVTEGVVAILQRPTATDKTPDSDIAVEELAIGDLAPLAALTVGQSAIFADEVESVTRISEEALDRKLLWRGGFIAFAGEPLSAVVADVSRYTEMTIEIDSPELESVPIGGYFRVGEVEDMFDSLETSFGVTVQRVSPTHVILRRAS